MNVLKKVLGVIRRLLPHGVLILSLDVITLLILHSFNPRMGFLTSPGSKTIIALLAVLAAVQAVVAVIGNRRNQD